jgi:hypothetical protein
MNIKPIMKSAKEASESEAVNSVIFYPAERVHEIFSRLKAARGTAKEGAELKLFTARMQWLYENQSDTGVYWIDEEELIRLAAYGEAVEDAERTAKLLPELAFEMLKNAVVKKGDKKTEARHGRD